MRNSSGWLTFDPSCVIELLNFQELYNKFITKFENQAILNHGWRRVEGYRISINKGQTIGQASLEVTEKWGRGVYFGLEISC